MNDIVGRKFGSLTVIEQDRSFHSQKYTKWICKCDCGNVKSINRNSLIQGRTKSCGCERYERKKGINKTHGMSNTRIYHEWASMKRRCKAHTKNEKNYYSRGIAVCKEWETDFVAFHDWAMKNGYNDSLSIDRIDNDKGYSPENCRWIPIEAQQSNKTNNVYFTVNGKKHCLRGLCAEKGFPYKTAYRRLQRMKLKGTPIDIEKLFEPIHKEKIAFRYRKRE